MVEEDEEMGRRGEGQPTRDRRRPAQGDGWDGRSAAEAEQGQSRQSKAKQAPQCKASTAPQRKSLSQPPARRHRHPTAGPAIEAGWHQAPQGHAPGQRHRAASQHHMTAALPA